MAETGYARTHRNPNDFKRLLQVHEGVCRKREKTKFFAQIGGLDDVPGMQICMAVVPP
jgi:hypothetical protein